MMATGLKVDRPVDRMGGLWPLVQPVLQGSLSCTDPSRVLWGAAGSSSGSGLCSNLRPAIPVDWLPPA